MRCGLTANFEKSIEEEYIISHNKGNLQRRVPYGLVFIRPQMHTRFFSIISAVAAAIAAGNCVLLEVCVQL